MSGYNWRSDVGPRRGSSACSRCSRRRATGRARSSPRASRSARGRSATTSSGCATSATRSTRRAGRSAATASRPAPRCRRCCSRTTRRSPWRSACGRRPAAPSPGSRRRRCGRSRSSSRCCRRGCGARCATLQGVTVHVRRGRAGPTVDPAMLTELARLARDHFPLRFDYSDRRETASQRRVEPYRLVNAGQRWYLVAWDLDRADWRTFRVDRMRAGMSPAAAVRAPRADRRARSRRSSPAASRPRRRRYQARVVVHAPAARLTERSGRGSAPSRPSTRPLPARRPAPTARELAVHLGLLGADFRSPSRRSSSRDLRTLARRYASSTTAA